MQRHVALLDRQRVNSAAMRAENMLAVPAGDNVVRLLPPLTLTDEDIRDGVERIGNAASSLTGTDRKVAGARA